MRHEIIPFIAELTIPTDKNTGDTENV